MDLKDVITKVGEEAKEAENGFNAGHKEKTYLCFKTIYETIRECFDTMSPAESIALVKATSESPAETLEATQAKDSGNGAQPASPARQFLGENVGLANSNEKPTQ